MPATAAKGTAPSPATAVSSATSLEQIPIDRLHRVGPKIAERLGKLGIVTVADLLFHLPIRYQDRTRVRPIHGLAPGEEVVIEGRVTDAQIAHGRRRSLKVWLEDDSGGALMLRFFHFGPGQTRALRSGTRLRCFGEVRQGPQSLEMVHPEYEAADVALPLHGGETLTPVYPSTEGMQQVSWRGLTDQALALLADDPQALPDWLPPEIGASLSLPGLAKSVRVLHRPPTDAGLADLAERRHPAFQRLAFEEMLAQQLALRRLRAERRGLAAVALQGDGNLRRRLLDVLVFDLTAAQRRVVNEIAADLAQTAPMMRLLQGDVGSGKTVVAAMAALQAVEADHQAALMAPTELLAEQHLRSIKAWLSPLGIEPLWLSGRHKGAERGQILARIADGSAPVLIGTHALIQDDVRFAALGLAIVDEQHRFGVHQRLALREKGAGSTPHQLIMTATPIPRSLAMSLYADLDLSVLDELPPGRTPVKTVAVPDSRRVEVIDRVRDACAAGRQAYWVCTLVEESDALQAQAAEDTAAELIASLPGLRVGLVHGRLRPAEREPVMAAFATGELDLLVATTVIEVGVDVPDASLMIIENPERLGLAQLHQLRGRVGRGRETSFCLLLYHPPLTATATDRLDILRREHSGFAIADADLRQRGAGEVLGTRQSGLAQFRLADPLRDETLVPKAQRAADRLLRDHPDRVEPLIRRWLGRREDYGLV